MNDDEQENNFDEKDDSEPEASHLNDKFSQTSEH